MDPPKNPPETTPPAGPGPLAGLAAWSPAGLVLDKGLAARAVRSRLSVSSAHGISSCPARFAVEHLLTESADPFGASELGSAAHAVFEQLFGLPANERTTDAACELIRSLPIAAERARVIVETYRRLGRLGLPARTTARALTEADHVASHRLGPPGRIEAVRLAEAVWPEGQRRNARNAARLLRSLPDDVAEVVAPPADADLPRWFAEIESRVLPLWRIEDPTTVDVWERELRLETDISGVPFVGFVDRVDHGADGAPVPNDFKAGVGKVKVPGRFGDPHGDQIRLYAVALSQHYGLMPSRGRVLYTFHGRSREVDCSPGEVRRSVGRFVLAWEEMQAVAETATFPARPSPLCGWCPLALVCPQATAAGKDTPRIDAALLGPYLGVDTAGMAVAGAGPEPVFSPGALPERPETTTRSEPAGGRHPGARLVGPELPLSDHKQTTRSEPVGTETGSTDRSNDMTTAQHPSSAINQLSATEDKAWIETVDGRLNPNSYAAMGVFGLVEMAVEALIADGVRLTTTTVDAMAGAYARVIAEATTALGVPLCWSDGLNTRLRGALRTTVAGLPAPVGGTDDAWVDWTAKATRRTVAIALASVRLWDADIAQLERPWGPLSAPQAAVA